MWSFSRVCGGATAAGIVLAVSSWRRMSTNHDRKNVDEPVFTTQKSHLANCSNQNSVHRGILPSTTKAPPSSNHEASSTPIQANQVASTLSSSTSPSENAIVKCRHLIRRKMLERGIPGAVVAVMKDGRLVWSEGIGYADIENDVPCTSDTLMRIASISKPLTTVGLLQQWERGLVDLDAPVQKYVPEFPEKEHKGEKVVVTTRQLLSHMAGIRHYAKSKKEGK